MAIPTGAYQRSDIVHELEDIRDIIYDVSPEETPFISNAPQGTCDNTKHEWHTDELDDVNVANAHIDGENFVGETITPTVRLDNECQIGRKDFVVTRRARRINKAGQRDELARQVTRKGRELKRDMEAISLLHQGKVADNGAVAPLLGGLPCYVQGTAIRGATGADPVGTGPTLGSAAPGLGTKRALSETDLLAVTKLIYDDSQELPNVLMLDTASKQNFSKYMFSSSARVATQYQDQGKSPRGGVRVVGAVDTWVTDYCVLDVVPNRFMQDMTTAPTPGDAGVFDSIIYNTDWVDICYFDPISTDAMAKVADTDDRMVLADWTVVPRNPATIGIVADVDSTVDMVA